MNANAPDGNNKLEAYRPVLILALLMPCMIGFAWAQFSIESILLILAFLLFGMVTYCGVFFDAQARVAAEGEPRSPSSHISSDWRSSIGSAVTTVLPGVMFVTGLVWLAVPLWELETLSGLDGASVAAFTWFVVKALGLSVLIIPGGMMAAAMIGMMLLGIMMGTSRIGLAEEDIRARKFQEMMFAGTLDQLFSPLEAEQNGGTR